MQMQETRLNQIILHIDMDSFFAAVEVLDDPFLRDVPVVVGADPKEGVGRGVVSTCSYEARAHGVHSGMPISKEFRLLSGKGAVFLPARMQRYREVSDRVMEVLRGFADVLVKDQERSSFIEKTKTIIFGDLKAENIETTYAKRYNPTIRHEISRLI